MSPLYLYVNPNNTQSGTFIQKFSTTSEQNVLHLGNPGMTTIKAAHYGEYTQAKQNKFKKQNQHQYQ